MSNEQRIVESGRPERRALFDPQTTLILVLIGIMLLLIFGVLIRVNWDSWGKPTAIIACVLIGIPVLWKVGTTIHLHGLDHIDRRHQHKDIEHRRDTVTQALAMGCSVQVKYGDGSEMNIIHPTAALAANASSTTIKELNWGQQQLPVGPLYPTAPPFASMKSLIRPGRLVLGYNTQGPIVGDVSDLLSMAFVGKPGTGKSTGLLYYLAILLLVDASVYVLDPQGSLFDVADLLPYYGEYSEIYNVLPVIYEEIEEREELFRRNKGQTRKPLLLLVDELPALARYEEKNKPRESVLDLAGKIVTENRKHNCFCMLTGQSLPANVLPTLTRDNLSSRIVFNSSDMHARMAGLDQDSRKLLLPLLRKAQPGTAILDVSRRPQPEVCSLPFTTVDDLRMIVDSEERSQEHYGNGSSVPDAFPAWGAVPDIRNGNGNGVPDVSPEERERIIELANSGIPRREMCLAMGKGKHYYDVIKQVLDEEDL